MNYKKLEKKYIMNNNEIDKLKIFINENKNSNIFFGFDIAKDFHYLSVLWKNNSDEIIFDIWEIKNNINWFKKLKDLIKYIISIWISDKNIYIWLEVTWSYYFSLLKLLKSIGLENIYVINWSKIKNYNLSINNSQTKNDKQDSIIICKYISTNIDNLEKNNSNKNWIIIRNNWLEISNLKFLYRQLRKEKQERKRLMSRIKELTNRVFPEIFEVFKSANCKPWIIEYYIKSNFTKQEIIRLEKEVFYKKLLLEWKINDKNKNNQKKIYQLHDLLKKSIWIDDSSWFYKFQMKMFVEKYYNSIKNIEKIESYITKEIKKQKIYIPKIPWASEISIWLFYAELWDSIFTKNNKEIAWFIWWYPNERTSWWKLLSKPRIEKKWNKLLREQVYLLAYSLCSKVTEINDLKKKIIQKKKIKAIEALIIIWSILIRIISSLYKKAQDFDINKFRSNYLE